MHRTSISLALINIVMCSCAFAPTIAGQAKTASDVDVTRCWTYPIGERNPATISSDNTHIFIGSAGAKIDALSMDGKKTWGAEFGGEITSNLMPHTAGLIFSTSSLPSETEKAGTSTLRSLSKDTGITNWTIKLPAATEHFVNIYREFIVVVSANGVVQSIDARNGAVAWKREIAEGFASRPAFNVESVIVTTAAKQIFNIALTSGQIESMSTMPYRTTAVVKVPGGVVIGDERGGITSFINGSGKRAWRFKTGGEVTNLFATGVGVIATSNDNFVYFLVSRTGRVVWKRRLSGRIAHIFDYAGQFAVISGVEENRAVFADIKNGKVSGQMAFEAGETLAATPIAVNGQIFVLTNLGAYAYSLNGCLKKTNAVPVSFIRDRSLKTNQAAKPLS
ncbi:MAG: PQQ-binding-like beta-propeller repeat protein [Pyrinomonadaceae bacterium]